MNIGGLSIPRTFISLHVSSTNERGNKCAAACWQSANLIDSRTIREVFGEKSRDAISYKPYNVIRTLFDSSQTSYSILQRFLFWFPMSLNVLNIITKLSRLVIEKFLDALSCHIDFQFYCYMDSKFESRSYLMLLIIWLSISVLFRKIEI